jgi:RNA-directed DNA polymerase
METICDPDNIETAIRAVERNKGAPGANGITFEQLPGILKPHWSEIEDQLLQGRYQPQPVRRVQIPKPAGGMRNLGTPTVIDRLIQQAVLQRRQPLRDPRFIEHSSGAGLPRSSAPREPGGCLIRRTAVVRIRMPGGVGGRHREVSTYCD